MTEEEIPAGIDRLLCRAAEHARNFRAGDEIALIILRPPHQENEGIARDVGHLRADVVELLAGDDGHVEGMGMAAFAVSSTARLEAKVLVVSPMTYSFCGPGEGAA